MLNHYFYLLQMSELRQPFPLFPKVHKPVYYWLAICISFCLPLILSSFLSLSLSLSFTLLLYFYLPFCRQEVFLSLTSSLSLLSFFLSLSFTLLLCFSLPFCRREVFLYLTYFLSLSSLPSPYSAVKTWLGKTREKHISGNLIKALHFITFHNVVVPIHVLFHILHK